MERKSALLVLFVTFAFALLLLPRPTHAMTFRPTLFDFTVNPGDVVTDVINVYNEEGVPFKVTSMPVNFYAKENDEGGGSPDFYDAKEVRNGYELGPWIQYKADDVVIPPNKTIDIPFSIHVPANATPGGHFGAIEVFATKPDEVDASGKPHVAIERGTAALIFVRVSGGNVKDDLTVAKFGVQSPILNHLPADFTIRLSNDGNTYQRPIGNVIIKNSFGKQVASLQVNPGPPYGSVLPGSARRFDTSWVKQKVREGTSEYESEMRNFAFGHYTATLLLNYGTDKEMKNLIATTQFWVIPWMVLATLAVIIIIAIIILVLVLRSYNKNLIRRYEARKPR